MPFSISTTVPPVIIMAPAVTIPVFIEKNLCFLCRDGQAHDQCNAVPGCNVYVLGRDENAVRFYAVIVVSWYHWELEEWLKI